jgi:D-sedoheptulose 7-phosphate isomerase
MTDQAASIIEDYAERGARLRSEFFSAHGQRVMEVARVIAVAMVHGGKVMFCGNGGSAADAQHLAAEFVSRFQMERPPLPALALTTDSSILTAIMNDYGQDDVFSKQVKALGKENDILVGISTSGKSPNVSHALETAKEKNIVTVCLVGKDGGDLIGACDYALHVEEDTTALVQEVHITVGHLLCRLVDYYLFEAVDKLQDYI